MTNGSLPIEADTLFISRSNVVAWLKSAALLRESLRQDCLLIASRLPKRIAVGSKGSQFSCDFVAVRGRERFYWEFHEQQHRRLTDPRPKLLYGPGDEPHEVPRYFQRLVRDLWRIDVCQNLTVVWYDYFKKHGQSYEPSLRRGFVEHGLSTKLSFGRIAVV